MRPLRYPRLWRALLLCAVIAAFVVCLLPAPPDPIDLPDADKLYHLLGYALLAAALVQVYAGRTLALRLGALLLFGLLVEAVQGMLPWRSADPADLVANALGVAAGGLLALTPLALLLVRLEGRLLPRRGGRR